MATRTTSKQKPKATIDPHAATTATHNGAVQATPDLPAGEISSPVDTAVDMVMISHTEAVQVTESSGRAVLDGMTKMQEDMASFVSKRIQHDLEAQQEMLRCRNFDEFQAVQTRFFRTAMEHYSDETRRLMRLSSEVIHRSVNREA